MSHVITWRVTYEPHKPNSLPVNDHTHTRGDSQTHQKLFRQEEEKAGEKAVEEVLGVS